jgi:hypothetical protein
MYNVHTYLPFVKMSTGTHMIRKICTVHSTVITKYVKHARAKDDVLV